MSLYQGLLGAQVELAGISSPVQKLRRIASISKLFASELVSTITLAPFAVRALRLHKSLPHADSYSSADEQPVYVVRDVRYAEAPRALIDLYLPTEAAAAAVAAAAAAAAAASQPEQQQQQQRQQLAGPAGNGSSSAAGVPVVVFVHGGVWAAGDKWHYAPMAHYLARLGVMACVVQYTLYPEGLVPQLVDEVSAAFDWAMEHVQQYGGDTQQASLVGHSAGAQLCMMALLQRAQQAHTITQQQQQLDATPLQQQQQQQQRMPHFPRQFVAITGVYDIAKHYSYEKERGVHELSTMKRAMGGFEGFAAMSPAVILGAALQQQQQQQQDEAMQQQQQGEQQEPPVCAFYSSFQLAGESIAHRIGFERGSAHHFASEAALQLQSTAGMSPLMPFELAAARFLPPTVLLSSCTDLTVPWYESAEMYYRLLDCGVPAKHLVYNKVGHGDFVVDWPTRLDASSSDEWGAPSSGSSSSSSHGATQQQQPAQNADDWGSSEGSTTSANSSSNGRSPVQQRQVLLEQLPHYLQDVAVVTMGQQQVNFVQREPLPSRKAVQLSGPAAAAGAAGGWRQQQQQATSVDARVVVEAAELN